MPSLRQTLNLRQNSGLAAVSCLLMAGLLACGLGSPALPVPAASASPASVEAASVETASVAPDPPTVDSLIREVKTQIHEASEAGSLGDLKRARAQANRATKGKRKALAHYYAALADFRMIALLSDEAEAKREEAIQDGISHLKRTVDLNPQMADAWALLAGCYGRMMGINPMQGMSLGPKFNEAMEKAKTLAPKNPRVWIVSGTQDFYTPSMFGGDKSRALKKFKKAARLAKQESITDPLMPSWGHAEAHAWIGLAHMNAERYGRARAAFEKALDINPDYGWVKRELLPRLKNEMG